jgi:hypothetical protein
MVRKLEKGAVATGISLGRKTYDDAIDYHQRVEKFFRRTEGRRVSLSETMEVLITTGLEVVKELDFDKVMEAMRKRGTVPKGVHEKAKEMKARTLGRMTDEEIKAMLKKEEK